MKQFKRAWAAASGVVLLAVILFLFPMTAKPADIPGVARSRTGERFRQGCSRENLLRWTKSCISLSRTIPV